MTGEKLWNWAIQKRKYFSGSIADKNAGLLIKEVVYLSKCFFIFFS